MDAAAWMSTQTRRELAAAQRPSSWSSVKAFPKARPPLAKPERGLWGVQPTIVPRRRSRKDSHREYCEIEYGIMSFPGGVDLLMTRSMARSSGSSAPRTTMTCGRFAFVPCLRPRQISAYPVVGLSPWSSGRMTASGMMPRISEGLAPHALLQEQAETKTSVPQRGKVCSKESSWAPAQGNRVLNRRGHVPTGKRRACSLEVPLDAGVEKFEGGYCDTILRARGPLLQWEPILVLDQHLVPVRLTLWCEANLDQPCRQGKGCFAIGEKR